MRNPDRRNPDRAGSRAATLTTKDVVFIYTGQGGRGGQGIFARKLSGIFPPFGRGVPNTFPKYPLTTLTTLDIVDKNRELSGQGNCCTDAGTLASLTTAAAPLTTEGTRGGIPECSVSRTIKNQ